MNVAECQSILSAGDTLGSYRIERFLGQGGFGVTYLAHDIMLDLPVAIKEYLPEQLAARTTPDGMVLPRSADAKREFKRGLEGFIKEARTLARFKHPNIVRIMGVFERNGTAYIVMEYENGQDLKAMLGKAGQISQQQLERIIGPILDGLEEVHRHGFIHRDIKPANIRIRNDGTPVLLDFGAARHQTQNHAGAMTALVSAGFAPMEQYTNKPGAQNQGPWTDIYALGAVLYYAVTGTAPADSAVRGSALLNDKPDPLIPLTREAPAGYTPAFCRAVDWAMRFKVSQRPQSLAQWRPRLLQEQLNASGAESAYPAVKRQSSTHNVTMLHSKEPRMRPISDSDTASDSFLDLIDQQLAAAEKTERDESLAQQKTRRPNVPATVLEDSAAKPVNQTSDGVVDTAHTIRQIRWSDDKSSVASGVKQAGLAESRRKESLPEKTKQKETRQQETRDSGAHGKQRQYDVPWEQEPWEDVPWENKSWENKSRENKPHESEPGKSKTWKSESWEIDDINERSHSTASDKLSTREYETTTEPPWVRKTVAVVTGALLVAAVIFFSLPALLPGESEDAMPPPADWVVSSVDTLSLADTSESAIQPGMEQAVSRDTAVVVAVPDTASKDDDTVEYTSVQSDDMQPSVIENDVAANPLDTAEAVALAAATAADSDAIVPDKDQSLEVERAVQAAEGGEDQSLEVERTVQAAEALRQRELERLRWFGEAGPAANESARPLSPSASVEEDDVVVALNQTPADTLDVTNVPLRDDGTAIVDAKISDRDMAEVLRTFDTLSLAIMERDIDAVKELTMPSERIHTYLEYLFSTFETIEVGVSDIQGSHSRQRITGTIRIREMVRPDGERVPPPSEFAAINVYSVRSGDWSKIHW